MPLGPNDLKQIVLPTNLDATTLQKAALAVLTTRPYPAPCRFVHQRAGRHTAGSAVLR